MGAADRFPNGMWGVCRASALALLPFVALGLAAAYLEPQRAPENSTAALDLENGGLSVPEAALDFGDVWPQRALAVTLPVTNTTDRDVCIREFTGICPCSSRWLAIASGRTVPVHLTLDLRPRSEDDTSTPLRAFAERVVPQIKGMGAQVGWRVHGNVRNILVLAPPLLSFEDSVVRGGPAQTRSVRIRSHQPLVSLRAVCPEGMARAELRPSDDEVETFELSISPSGDLPIGSFTFNVFLEARTRGGSQLPPTEIVVSGEVREDLYLAPASVLLRPTRIGASEADVSVVTITGAAIARVEIERELGAPFRVSEPEICTTGGRFRLAAVKAPAGAHFSRVRVRAWKRLADDPVDLYLSVATDARKSSKLSALGDGEPNETLRAGSATSASE